MFYLVTDRLQRLSHWVCIVSIPVLHTWAAHTHGSGETMDYIVWSGPELSMDWVGFGLRKRTHGQLWSDPVQRTLSHMSQLIKYAQQATQISLDLNEQIPVSTNLGVCILCSFSSFSLYHRPNLLNTCTHFLIKLTSVSARFYWNISTILLDDIQ